MFLYIVVEVVLIMMVLCVLFVVLFYKMKQNENSLTSYECGFMMISEARLTFSYRFFLISILFVIFDVEVSLMLPVPYLKLIMLGVWVFILFMFIMIFGLLYEYFYGSLDWMDNFITKA